MTLIARDALRTMTRQYADQEGGTFCTDTEINTMLGLAYQGYHDLLTNLFEDYDSTYSLIAATTDANGCYVITLPSDFDKLRKVELQYGGVWAELEAVKLAERNRYDSPFASAAVAGAWRGYTLFGASLRLLPELGASGTYRVWYAKRCAGFPDDTTGTVDDQQGWYEYIPLAAAIKCTRKEQNDSGELRQDLAQKIADIKAYAADRDASGPTHITDGWCDGVDDMGYRFP